MLEWYRVGDDMAAGMKLLAELVESILETSPVKCMSYREAFLEFAGIDVVEAEPARLSELSDLSPEVIRDEHLNIILAKEVEPKLGQELPVLLYDYPATQAALAKIRIDRGVAYAERFELYFKGVELANGYHELLDPDELELRNEEVNRQRISDGRQPLPSSSRLLSAMQFGLPSCAGVAMGVDRLLMLDQNLSSIDEALAFPFDRA
jgi:lysyl-tRNA synthetase class 2